MCDETVLVPIPDHLIEGEDYDYDPAHNEYGLDDQGRRCFAIDRCIVPALRALWQAGIRTRGCCCGHGGPSGVVSVKTEGALRPSPALASLRRRSGCPNASVPPSGAAAETSCPR